MDKPYQPELGQMVFGQPWKEYEGSELLEAALRSISNELDRAMWNIEQKEYSSPFDNTGNRFECDTFKAHAYSWSDDEQPWNFKWRDVEISWYKWSGRGLTTAKPLSPDLISEMLDDCLAAVRRYEKEHNPRSTATAPATATATAPATATATATARKNIGWPLFRTSRGSGQTICVPRWRPRSIWALNSRSGVQAKAGCRRTGAARSNPPRRVSSTQPLARSISVQAEHFTQRCCLRNGKANDGGSSRFTAMSLVTRKNMDASSEKSWARHFE